MRSKRTPLLLRCAICSRGVSQGFLSRSCTFIDDRTFFWVFQGRLFNQDMNASSMHNLLDLLYGLIDFSWCNSTCQDLALHCANTLVASCRCRRRSSPVVRTSVHLPQHFLYFLPLPQGHGSLRPIFRGRPKSSMSNLWLMIISIWSDWMVGSIDLSVFSRSGYLTSSP